MIITKTHKDLKGVLMNKENGEVKTPYYLIEDNRQTIFVVSPGRNGMEFNKTVGYFNSFPGMQTYISLHGSGIMLMQRNDEFGEAKEFKVVFLSSLKQIIVPAGWGMCLVNTGSSYLLVLRSTPLDKEYIDSKPIIEKKGLAYFVIERKGEIIFEPNSSYSVHPQISTE